MRRRIRLYPIELTPSQVLNMAEASWHRRSRLPERAAWRLAWVLTAAVLGVAGAAAGGAW